MNATRKIEALGVKLAANGDKLRITGNTKALTRIFHLKAR